MTIIALVNPNKNDYIKTEHCESYKIAEERAAFLNDKINKSGNKSGKYWTTTVTYR